MSFAIVILNHKTSHLLDNLLKHVLNRCGVAAEQIYVVDNSLDIGERLILDGLVRLYRFNLTILECNRGYSAGNNVGIENAINSGFSHIYVVNPDVLPNSDVFIEMYRKYADNKIGFCVGPSVYNPYIKIHENPLKSPSFFLGLFGLAKEHKGDGVLLAGSFLFFDKEFWSRVGGFPEEVFMYNEETILHHKALKESLITIYDPSFEVLHNHEKSFKGFSRELSRKRSQLNSSIYVMKNYLEWPSYKIHIYVFLYIIRTMFLFVYKIIRYGKI